MQSHPDHNRTGGSIVGPPNRVPPPVTSIGLRPMGQAMTRAFLKNGYPVRVWNRTARGSAGASAASYAPYVQEITDTLAALIPDAAREIFERHYPGDTATLEMMGATADHIVPANRDAGLDLALPEAIRSQYARALASGYGRKGWTRLIVVIEAGRNERAATVRAFGAAESPTRGFSGSDV